MVCSVYVLGMKEHPVGATYGSSIAWCDVAFSVVVVCMCSRG